MIRENIRELCRRHNISITKLEETLGFSNGAIGKWDKSSPKAENLAKVADYFGVTTDYLLGRDRRLDLVKLQSLRKDKIGETVGSVAKAIGITAEEYEQIENGMLFPNETTTKLLAEHFVVDVDELFISSTGKPLQEIIRPQFDYPKFAEQYPDAMPYKAQKVPILGRIACGVPLMETEDFEGYIDFIGKIKPDFCLICKGDSMIGARIHDGDIVFIRQQPSVENGEIAAVSINDEVTLKRIYTYDDSIELRAENPMFKPIIIRKNEFDRLVVLGKAIAFQSRIV